MSQLAVLQMRSTDCLQSNLQQAEQLIAEACEAGAQLVLLPENFALLGCAELHAAGWRESRNEAPDTIRNWLAKMARHYGIWLVGGSLPMASRPDGSALSERVRAVCLVMDAQGREVARYDKIHLFDAEVSDAYGCYRESDTVEPGDQLVVIDTPCGRLGLSICYDLRFPELFYALRARGAEIISVPSAFTATTGAAHWEVLLRARAVETQCYVLGANQVGEHSAGRHSFGHSMIVDPWGEVLQTLTDAPGFVCVARDALAQEKIRRRMPVMDHRRLLND